MRIATGLIILLVAGCGGAPARPDSEPSPSASAPAPGDSKARPSSAEPPKPAPPEPNELEQMTSGLGEGDLRARLVTSEGAIDCELFEEAAPATVANFVGLARGLRPWLDPASDEVVVRPLYDGLTFFRVIPDFAIQTGDPTNTGRGGPGYRFDDEFSGDHRHDRPGVMSMANHGPNTNGSQFFITQRAAAHLDFRHTVFGLCDNLDVVDAIARSPTGPDDEPVDPPVLKRVEIYRSSD